MARPACKFRSCQIPFFQAQTFNKTFWSSLKLPLEENDSSLQQLLEACEPSAHGRGNETVYDESYRLARELPRSRVALTEDILTENDDVLATISALVAPRNKEDGIGIVARMYKLNAYTVGSFFKAHRDTPKSDRHIGTLVVALPVPFEGGALRVSHKRKHVLFDWGKDINTPGSSSATHVKLPWAFLFSDVEHEVLPVTSGTRVILAYNIFISDKPTLATSPSLDATTLPLYTDMKAVIENQLFLPGGGRVAVALSHAYPIGTRSSLEAFASHLKGTDAVLYQALLKLGVPISLRAVFSPTPVNGSTLKKAGSDLNFPDDGFGPVRTFLHGNESRDKYYILYTSDKLGEYRREWQGEMEDFFESDCKMELDIDLICE